MPATKLARVAVDGDTKWSGPYVDPIRHGWFGKEIADYLGISAPYSQDDLLDFFETLTSLYDQTVDARGLAPVESEESQTFAAHAATRTKTNETINLFIAARLRLNRPSAEIRAEVAQHFQVNISASHMSNLRHRLAKRDTLQMRRDDFDTMLATHDSDDCLLWPYAKSEGYGQFLKDGTLVHAH